MSTPNFALETMNSWDKMREEIKEFLDTTPASSIYHKDVILAIQKEINELEAIQWGQSRKLISTGLIGTTS